MSDRRIDYGYSDDETFEEVYEYWYAQYDLFEGEDDSWKYCIIKEKPCSLRSASKLRFSAETVTSRVLTRIFSSADGFQCPSV
ncbi:hypothetical protein H8E77_11430 [bacterium]|nr:hypothetical protein [bacterium]